MMLSSETAGRASRWGGFFALPIALLLLLALDAANPARAMTPLPSPLASHKIQVSDPALFGQIEAAGGRLVADYGGFRLYETGQIPLQLLANPRLEIRDNYNSIALNTGPLDTRTTGAKALRKPLAVFTGKRLHLVQFAGPIQSQWRAELLASGSEIVAYIPQNTYLIYGDNRQLAQVQILAAQSPCVQWDGAYLDDYKIHPLARTVDVHGRPRAIGTDLFDIQLVSDDEANVNTLALLNTIATGPFQRLNRGAPCLNLVVRLSPQHLNLVAAQPDVISILPYFPRHKLDERQDQIVAGHLTNGVPNGPGYLAWLASKGFTQAQFTASGFIVDISDTGVDNGTTSPAHFGLYVGGNAAKQSRVVYNRVVASATYPTNSVPPNALEGCDGHGTINAHIIAGYDDFSGFPFADARGFHYGLGVCPFVSIGSSVIFGSVQPDGSETFYGPVPQSHGTDNPDPNYFDNLQSQAYHAGARISNNSWGGASSSGLYDSEAQNYDRLVRDAQPANSEFPADGNQPMVIVFSAGNNGPGTQTVDTPGTAKNVITVGAADNVQLFGGSDNSGVSDSEAQSANEVFSFSSRGPCVDGRTKPDLLAPGTHVSGGAPQATNDMVNFPLGLADSCFDGYGISGGVNSLFWPTNQQFYTASSGTSQAAPCVSGGCALLFQYFLNNFGTNLPSPAMTKAYLLNSARYLTGATADDTLPSSIQGMGEMDLGAAFDGVPRILRDQVPSDLFTNSGQFRSVTGVISDTNTPFRVTLAWTDAPGSPASREAYDNDLDLVVTVGGNAYLGNVFNGAYSTTGGTPDEMNNVESVFLPAGVSGNFVVTVTANNINSVGVPNSGNLLNQDFALVVYNARPTTLPVIAAAGTVLVAEGCYPTNGVIDPGETVTVNLGLQNVGTAATSNLVATLLTNSGVQGVSAPQTYGALPAASAGVSRPFTFTAVGTCGGTITATLQLQDGATNLGMFNFQFPLGTLNYTNTFAQNFDGVTPPALPANWTSTASGGQIPWITSTNSSYSPTTSAFVPAVALRGLSDLISPVIPIVTTSAQLTFANSFDLESVPSESPAPTSAFDGGVLEIRIDNGGFVDILAAGGSFVMGGYNTIIDTNSDNPLGQRQVWSGNPGGFISTVVNLPAAAAGHNIQLRWRCGTDTGNPDGGTGWYIDSISLMDGYWSCCSELLPPTILNPQCDGTNTTFSFPTMPGKPYRVQFKNYLTDPTWMLLQPATGDGTVQTITDPVVGPQRFYRIVSP
jgi:hypothetical protein